jgi:hypothetical protein
VTVLPFRPKETLLLFEKTAALRFWDVVPAERLSAEMSPAVDGTV